MLMADAPLYEDYTCRCSTPHMLVHATPCTGKAPSPIADLGQSFSDLVADGWIATGAVIAMEYLLMEKNGAYAVCTLQIGGGMSLYPKLETTSVDSACYKVSN
ncbi:MAG: hypothetical protein ACK5II_07855 [Paracoccus sp. (in: a-proteobacteria)]